MIRTSSLHNLQGPVQHENASPFVQNQEKSAIKGVKILYSLSCLPGSLSGPVGVFFICCLMMHSLSKEYLGG